MTHAPSRWRPGWKAKAALQRAFSVLPGGSRLNYLFQRHVTGGYPASNDRLSLYVSLARQHLEGLRSASSIAIAGARFYEFGAGWDLLMPVLLRAVGADHQTVIDIRPLARAELVRDVLGRAPETGLLSESEIGRLDAMAGTDLDSLLSAHGIRYQSQVDATCTGLPTGSVDFITSTSTLEHIPEGSIRSILEECRRILRPTGAVSFHIDYQDHYSYFDPRIGVYNFLTFDHVRWERYNPSIHFQNRLRHSDYLQLVGAAGFRVESCTTTEVTDADLAELRDLPLAAGFAGRDPRDLAVRGAHLVLTPC